MEMVLPIIDVPTIKNRTAAVFYFLFNLATLTRRATTASRACGFIQ